MWIPYCIRNLLSKLRMKKQRLIHDSLSLVVSEAVSIHDHNNSVGRRPFFASQVTKEVLELAVHTWQAAPSAEESGMNSSIPFTPKPLQQRANELLVKGILAEEGNLRHQNHPG